MVIQFSPLKKPDPNEQALCAVAFKDLTQNINLALFIVENFKDFKANVDKLSIENNWLPVQSSVMAKSDVAKIMAFNWNIKEPQFEKEKSADLMACYVRYVFEAGTEEERAIAENVISKFKKK